MSMRNEHQQVKHRARHPQRFASTKEQSFAAELDRAGIQWEYAPRIGPIRVADFRLPDHGRVLVEVYSGGEFRKSPLPNCLVMPCETRRGMRAWIREMLARSSTR